MQQLAVFPPCNNKMAMFRIRIDFSVVPDPDPDFSSKGSWNFFCVDTKVGRKCFFFANFQCFWIGIRILEG
jgi:hypothetical protein